MAPELRAAPPIDRLIRSRRKTIALVVTPEAKLLVRAPLHTSLAQIEQLVAEKASWVHVQQAKMRARPSAARPTYQEGETFPYLGKRLPLHYSAGGPARLALREDGFHLASDRAPQAATLLLQGYRRQARLVLEERVQAYAAVLDLFPSSVRISAARTRWGSCSARGALRFTWRLVLAPLWVIDYVVVHELVHLKVKNHSPRFWERVQAAYPQTPLARRWLKENNRLGEEF